MWLENSLGTKNFNICFYHKPYSDEIVIQHAVKVFRTFEHSCTEFTPATLRMRIFKQTLNLWHYLKLLSWSSISIPSYGAFAALKRISSVSQLFYPQYLTWNPATQKLELTPKTKLLPWTLFSLVLLFINLSYYYLGFRQILAHTKDPEFSLINAILLVFSTCGSTIVSTMILSFVLERNEIPFALKNLQKMKAAPGAEGMYTLHKKWETVK